MKKVLIILFIAVFLIFFVPTFGKYATNEIKEYYLNSKNFYFNSDKMTTNGIVYQVENWNGIDSYTVTFNMNSYKNNIVFSESDIEYDIYYVCSDNVTCYINKTKGVISSSEHIDSFDITVIPNEALEDMSKATIQVRAKSTSPYEKELNGVFNIVVGKMGLSYEIMDEKGSNYFEVAITNTLDYYLVRTPFGDYRENQKIDVYTYLALSDEDKSKCASSIVTINFNTDKVILDMTAKEYLNSLSSTTNSFDYVSGFSFKIEALSSNKIKLYKYDSKAIYDVLDDVVSVSFE